MWRLCLRSGKSRLFCRWRGLEREKKWTDVYKRLRGCLCFHSDSSCVLIDPPSIQTMWACTLQTENRAVCCSACSRGNRRMECLLDLVSSVAVAFLHLESGGGLRAVETEVERLCATWLLWELNLPEEGCHKLFSVWLLVDDSLRSVKKKREEIQLWAEMWLNGIRW